jgi:hypothetical protein
MRAMLLTQTLLQTPTRPHFPVLVLLHVPSGMLPQIVMGAAVSFFFSGFVMGKIPFGLSPPPFRPM